MVATLVAVVPVSGADDASYGDNLVDKCRFGVGL